MSKGRLSPISRDELTIRRAQREVAYYLRAKGERWSRLSKHYRNVTYLVEEVGELARAVINIERKEELGRRGLNRSQRARLHATKDALGDILYLLFGISVAYGIDLQRAFQDSMRIIKKRYPVSH